MKDRSYFRCAFDSPGSQISVSYFMKKSIPKLNAVKYTTHNSSSLDYTMVTNNSVVYIFFKLFITKIYSNIKKRGKLQRNLNRVCQHIWHLQGPVMDLALGGGGGGEEYHKNNNIADVELFLLKKNTEAVNFAFGRRHATLIDFPTRRISVLLKGKLSYSLAVLAQGTA